MNKYKAVELTRDGRVEFSDARFDIHGFHRPPIIWSGRVSTNIFGDTYCRSGLRGPKGYENVIFGFGDAGLLGLISLGFIVCPTCGPRLIGTGVFPFEKIDPLVREMYKGFSAWEFPDKRVVPYDGSRLRYELLVQGGIEKLPDTIFLPETFTRDKVEAYRSYISGVACLAQVKEVPRLACYKTAVDGEGKPVVVNGREIREKKIFALDGSLVDFPPKN